MKENSKNSKKNHDDTGDGSYNYEDLINEFSSGAGKGEGSVSEGFDIEALMKKSPGNKDGSDDSPSDGADLTDIFDGLDDMARISILENPDLEAGDNENEGESDEGDSVKEAYTFGEISLDDDDEGGYASLLRELEKKESGSKTSTTTPTGGDSGISDDFAIDLDFLGGTTKMSGNGENRGDALKGEGGSGLSFDFENIDALSFSGDDGVVRYGENDVVENDASDSADDGDSNEIIVPDMQFEAESESHNAITADAFVEKGMTDTEAVEGVLTGEFSMDEIDLSDLGFGGRRNGVESTVDITAERLAYSDASEEATTESADRDDVKGFGLSFGDETKESSYAAALANFGDKNGVSETAGSAEVNDESGAYALNEEQEETVEVTDTDFSASANDGGENEKDTAGTEKAEEFDFSGEDLFAGGEPEEEAVKPSAQAQPKVEKAASAEDDFLGLGSLSAGGGGEESSGRFGGTVDVLFEGVEMDFDEQVANVTLAEVLIAQGKQDKAEALFKKVAAGKGVTHWVARRLGQRDSE